jgi:two-component system chemotaxis response regulator CheY
MSEDRCILVVDDFSTMRRIVKKILTGLNLTHVIEADNGLKAWDILNTSKVDLVICDWNMPGMTGMELLGRVRAHEPLSDIPFIMVTAESRDKIIIEEGKEDLTYYIGKPFKAQDLEDRLKSMLPGVS